MLQVFSAEGGQPMSATDRSTIPDGGLRGALTTPKIVFLVVAAAAPLAAMIGVLPLALALGAGAATPATYVAVGLILLCFSVGYAAMSRRITNTGGFYTYVAAGLGKPPAIAAALIAVIAYNAVAVELVGAFGYFTRLILQGEFGITLPWELYAGAAVLAVAVLGYRKVDLSARVLAVLMVAELAILLVLDTGVLGHKGGSALPSASFAPHAIMTAGFGLGLMFAFQSFLGFESAALYGEEARNPSRSVPLATYVSVSVIMIFYGFTSWVVVGAVGAGNAAKAANQQLGNLLFAIDDQYVAKAVTTVMMVAICTSLFASMLAIHNAASRYMFVLGREHVLPSWLGHAHGSHQSPSRASLVQTTVNVAVAGGFAVAGLDPYLNLATSMTGLGTLGIVILQAMAAVAVIGFFRRRPGRHWWKTGLAPLIGAAGLITAIALILANYSALTGVSNPVINSLPWLLAAAAIGGIGYALWLRRHRPHVYALIAAGAAEHPEAEMSPDVQRADTSLA
jgi:amino acid transporter